MGMTRERKVLVGLGAVAVAGLMFDKVVLSPAEAAAGTEAPQAASAAGPVQAVAAAVTGRVEAGIRDAMLRRLEAHVSESQPDLAFGPSAAWTERLTSALSDAAGANEAPADQTQAGPEFLPGLARRPTLTLVMPTRDGGGLAVIDGHRVRQGETHPDGYRVEHVGARSVTVTLRGSTATLSLPSPGN